MALEKSLPGLDLESVSVFIDSTVCISIGVEIRIVL